MLFRKYKTMLFQFEEICCFESSPENKFYKYSPSSETTVAHTLSLTSNKTFSYKYYIQ